jgi:hypothetical protein
LNQSDGNSSQKLLIFAQINEIMLLDKTLI